MVNVMAPLGLYPKMAWHSARGPKRERPRLETTPTQGDQKIGGKIGQILDKVAKTVAKLKNAIFLVAKFDNTKHLH